MLRLPPPPAATTESAPRFPPVRMLTLARGTTALSLLSLGLISERTGFTSYGAVAGRVQSVYQSGINGNTKSPMTALAMDGLAGVRAPLVDPPTM